MESKYLVHYGIKGQKRGVRRWTNADGTLNEAGKRRYYDDSDSGNSYTPTKFASGSGKSGTIEKNYYKFTEYDKGRNNRVEDDRREYQSRARSSTTSLDRRLNSDLPGSRRIRTSVVESSKTTEGDTVTKSVIDNKVSSRLNDYRRKKAERENGNTAPGSDTMERANIADKKGPYMSDEYRREVEYNSQKNSYPEPKQSYGTNDTASTADKRNERQTGKNSWSNFDNLSEKAQEQLFRNSTKTMNEKKEQENPTREWMWNPSKDISDVWTNKKDNHMMYLEKGNYERGEETSATPSQNNKARYGKNDTASNNKATKATATKPSSKPASNPTVSVAAKSSSVQKGINFLKKLFGK